MFLLKHRILQSILLRRTKSGRASDLALPPRIVSSSLTEFIDDEIFFYFYVFLMIILLSEQ